MLYTYFGGWVNPVKIKRKGLTVNAVKSQNGYITGEKALQLLRRGLETPNGQIVQLLDPLQLKVDVNYQRPVNKHVVKRLSSAFNAQLLGTFQVGRRRTGDNYIIDAQHRQALIKNLDALRDHRTPAEVVCTVSLNTTSRSEAGLFVGFNGGTPVKGPNKMRADIVGGDKITLEISHCVDSQGFSLEFLERGRPSVNTRTNTGISSPQWLYQCYKTGKLDDALWLLRTVWGGNNHQASNVDAKLRNGYVVMAVCRFLSQRQDNRRTIAKKLIGVEFADAVQRIRQQAACQVRWSIPREIARWLSELVG